MRWDELVRARTVRAGLPIPSDVTAPGNGTPLFRVIVRRQIMSLDFMRIPLRFWRAASMNPAALARRTVEAEWLRIRAEIDAGKLAIVGLIRHHGVNPMHLDRDHQVLAFAYETEARPAPPRSASTTRTGPIVTTSSSI